MTEENRVTSAFGIEIVHLWCLDGSPPPLPRCVCSHFVFFCVAAATLPDAAQHESSSSVRGPAAC